LFSLQKRSIEVSSRNQILEEIAARASTPPERNHYSYRVEDLTPQLQQQAQQRVQDLSTLLGSDDDEVLQRFLEFYHLNQWQVSTCLTSPVSEKLGFRPDWIEVLEQVVMMCWDPTSLHPDVPSLDRACFPEEPVPFEEVLLPFLRSARQQYLQSFSPQSVSLVSEQAQVTIEHWLLQRLAAVASDVLELEFSFFRAQHALWGLSPERRELYQAFVTRYQGEGLLSLLQEYSVLARLLVVVMEQWIEACREFLQRLTADLDAISQQFHDGSPLGPVIELQTGCSDPHHHGRSVFLVTFAVGLKVVYKPRSLAVDQAFFDLLTWCNTSGLTSPCLKTLRVLNRDSYGWMEYAEHASCTTEQEVENYYLRAGMLLCLLSVLGGTDMHHQNLVACGEHPILIDLETVMTPGYPFQIWCTGRLAGSLQPGDLACCWQTVLETLFLPAWTSQGDANHACDISGLGGVEGHIHPHPHRRWKHINTDAMCQESVEEPNPISLNTVLLQGIPQSPFAYAEQVVTGFRRLYLLLVARHRELCAPQGPLNAFKQCQLRFVCRGTGDYWNALTTMNQPAWLRDGTNRWIEMQSFIQPWLIKRADPAFLRLAEAEVQALEHLDIPWFGITAAGDDLCTDAGKGIGNLFPVSALQKARTRLASLNQADMERQVHLIRLTFLTARPMEIGVKEDFSSPREEAEEQKMLTSAELLAAAQQIAQQLQTLAFRERREKGTWVGLQYSETFKCYNVWPGDFGLYRGACGIALFLALLDSITGQKVYRELVTSALEPLCRDLAEAASSPSDPCNPGWGIGVADGLGSFIYALTHIGRWLGLSELHEVARQAASLLTTERVQQDEVYDVMGGSAGAILGLLCLYETTGDQQLIEQALCCAHHLLKQRVTTQSGARSWPGLKKHPLTGFSHGAAGIAYALLRLCAISGQEILREAAEEAISFEQHLFSPEHGNWPDLRYLSSSPDETQASVPYGVSWCHGAPGIGLARLGGLAVLDTPQVRHDLMTALQTTQAIGLPYQVALRDAVFSAAEASSAVKTNGCEIDMQERNFVSTLDNLCCGNFGCIELLIAASQRLHQPQLLEVAQRWSSALIRRARQQGGYQLLPQLPRKVHISGLFQGSAGIGYQFLRVAFPQLVPSLLLWQ
jgi:type 2 lantibiotic biosynthesis protein LanM